MVRNGWATADTRVQANTSSSDSAPRVGIITPEGLRAIGVEPPVEVGTLTGHDSRRANTTPSVTPTPARTAGTPHHPDLTSEPGDAPLIPAGENRMGLDIMDFSNPREGGDGRSTGRMYLPGYSGGSDGDPYVYQERPGGPWHVNSLPGDAPEMTARTPQELMAKVARHFGIHGDMRIEDEREGVRSSQSGTTRVEPRAGGTVQRAERTDQKAQLRAMSDTDLQAAYRNASGLDAKRYRAEIQRRENLVDAPVPPPAAPATPRRTRAETAAIQAEVDAGLAATVEGLTPIRYITIGNNPDVRAVLRERGAAATIRNERTGEISTLNLNGRGFNIRPAAAPTAPTTPALPDPPSRDMLDRLARFTPEEREQLRAEAAQMRANRPEVSVAGAWRGVIEGAEQDRLTGIGRYSRRPAASGGTGPGSVAIGATDADRRAARPRMEGETDRAYAVRTAPSRDAALRMLNSHQLAGLRAIARDEKVVTSGSKADLIARLIRVMRDRHEDSDAITRMVNRDRPTQPPAVTVTPPRTNAPATTGPITPTMTGSQLIAARRALQAQQQGANRPKA